MDNRSFKLKGSSLYKLGPSASQKGFVTLTGLSFITVIFTLVGAFGVLSHVIKKKMILSSHCVFHVLKLQKDLSKPLSSLLRLNPQATRLRTQEALAKAQLAAALATKTPPLIARARARLLQVQQRQLILKGRQDLLLIEARVRREEFHNQSLNQKSRAMRKTRFPEQSQSLAVKASPIGSRSPSYELVPDFATQQAQSYFISQQISIPGIQIFKWAFDANNLTIQYRCSATLKKKGELKWAPALKEDKESWRSFYGYF